MKEDNKNSSYEDHVSEAVSATARPSDDDQLYGIDNWPGMPLVGPANIDEVNARIDKAEREIENGEVYDWDCVMLDATNIVRQYAATIY